MIYSYSLISSRFIFIKRFRQLLKIKLHPRAPYYFLVIIFSHASRFKNSGYSIVLVCLFKSLSSKLSLFVFLILHRLVFCCWPSFANERLSSQLTVVEIIFVCGGYIQDFIVFVVSCVFVTCLFILEKLILIQLFVVYQ